MEKVFALDAVEKRKLSFLYHHSGIDTRYSVLPDYSLPPAQWQFYPAAESLEPFPGIRQRMEVFRRQAPALSLQAIRQCLDQAGMDKKDITHLITVSCTGMSAPGLELELMELLDLPRWTNRSCIHFMGCYAAIHGLKQADAICRAEPGARVLLVCTELCTLHFQKIPSPDNITSSLLFGDGSAAVLLQAASGKGRAIRGFYAEVQPAGKSDMSWEIGETGFAMSLSGYVPELIQADFRPFMERALQRYGAGAGDIKGWCIHPGGKRILEAVADSLGIAREELQPAFEVLREYGNMSSPTVLFVLKKMLKRNMAGPLLLAAFGPGLTMETCCLEAAPV